VEIMQTFDEETISQLNKSIQERHHRLYPEYFKPYHAEDVRCFFRGIIHNPHFIFLLLTEHEQPVGYAWIEVKQHPENAFKHAYKSIILHQISMNEAYMNNGYGSKLLEHIEQIAKSHQVNRIELDYWVLNEDAKAFYEKRGFKRHRDFVYKEV